MFERLRTALQNQLDAVRAPLEQAKDAAAAAQGEIDYQAARIPALQAALDQAQRNTQQANATLSPAQDVINQRQHARAAAQAALDTATNAANTHADEEPIDQFPNGHPNPEWRTWNRDMKRLRRVVTEAETALADAETALAQALPPRDAAQQAVRVAMAAILARHHELAVATAALAAAQANLATANLNIAVAQDLVGQRAAKFVEQIAALDVREHRMQDRTDMAIADAELFNLTSGRRIRHELYEDRAGAAASRAGALAAHDATIEELFALRETIAKWPGYGRYPSLAGVVAALDAVVAASRVQRQRPAAQRTDNLVEVGRVLDAQLTTLRRVVQQASDERTGAEAALQTARAELLDHQENGWA